MLEAAIFLSGLSLGAIVMLYCQIRTARLALEATTKEFNEILKKVSDINLSVSNKLVQIEEKVSTIDFWKQSSQPQAQNSFSFKNK